MTTKRKNERSFEATRKYNEYMRERYAKKRAEEGKSYHPKSEAAKETQVDTKEAESVIKDYLMNK